MQYIIRLERQTARPLAVVRRRTSRQQRPTVVPDACGLVWRVLKSQRIQGAGRHIAIDWDDQINLEVGVELEAPFPGHADVVASATPAGLVATTTHLGPYPQLHAAHTAIRDWCESNGHAIAGPNWEIYGHWQDDWNTNPSKISTDVHYLISENADSPSAPSGDT